MMSSTSDVLIVGFMMMFGGYYFPKIERGSLLFGRWYFSFKLSVTVRIDFFFILCDGRGASVSCLFGRFSLFECQT